MRISVLVLAAVLIASAAQAASPLYPVVANPGFEDTVPGNDAPGWGSYSRADAGLRSDTSNPHSGIRCMEFWDRSPVAPEVYLRFAQSLGVQPATEYELSVWVRGEDVASGQHFTDWNCYTMNLPSGTFGWTRVSQRIKTRPGQGGLSLGLNVVNTCKALAIDDIELRPVGIPIKGAGIDGNVLFAGQVEGDNRPAYLTVFLNSSLTSGATLEAAVQGPTGTLFQRSEPVKVGENTFDWEWNTSGVSTRNLTLNVAVRKDGTAVASLKRPVEKVSPAVLLGDIGSIERRLSELTRLYQKCRARGIAADYPGSAITMLRQFIPLTRGDIKDRTYWRANFAIADMNKSVDTAIRQTKSYLAEPSLAPTFRRYRTGELDIKGVSFVGDRTESSGKVTRGPVFFCGYGHFGQVREDIPRFPGYGANIIQIEAGPAAALPNEHDITLGGPADTGGMGTVSDALRALDRAAEQNIMVNVLLSPHYFPQWALEKWPSLRNGGGGFLGFCVDAPEAKLVMEKYLRAAIPLLAKKRALHSFCLSNEPVFDRSAGCTNTSALWQAYLEKTHGDIGVLNSRYNSKYASFAEVPASGGGPAQYYDWCVFNQQRFAGWHKWMADIIHEIAPDVPVHAKIMVFYVNRATAGWGVDPELFGRVSDINGNDSYISPGAGRWGISWHAQNLNYDLQRSVNVKPVFNSENHLQPDGSTYYVPPEHYRTALWQGAIHGQGATTIWVWDRTKSPSHPAYAATVPFMGQVLDRPGCAQAVGTTCLDLNRFAGEVTALETQKAPVAIVWSMASLINSPGYEGARGRVYEALNFCGTKVDFISETQLAEGKGANYRMIVFPECTHVSPEAWAGIGQLPAATRILVLGAPPCKNGYGQDYPLAEQAGVRERALVLAPDTDPEKVLWPALMRELGRLKALPPLSVLDARTSAPVWGVEWRMEDIGGRTVMNIVNLTSAPVTVKVLRGKSRVDARDLFSLGGREKVSLLKPITPVLAEVRK